MKFEQLRPREQLVATMKRIYASGMTTLSGGNLSVIDNDLDIWITPAGIDKGRLTADDIVRVRVGGAAEGAHRPSSEYPFHRAIYRWRPDLRAIVHAHSPALVSFCVARKIPSSRIIPQAERICGPVGYAPFALPGSEELGVNIAATFAQGYHAVLLENHGAVTAGPDLLSAFQRLETLDFCARTLLAAGRLGRISKLTEEQLACTDQRDHALTEFMPAPRGPRERELRQQMAETVRRACNRYLMISTEGVISARVGVDCFLITPTGRDRCSLDSEDMVLVEHGRREEGKLPSRSVRLHQAIYNRHPDVGCVITAQPPHATAYSITPTKFDTRAMAESYYFLRDMPVIPFETKYREPEQVAAVLSKEAPVLLIRNDGVLAAGGTILQAFDRLEVAEFSARSMIDSLSLGGPVPLGDDEIEELVGKLSGGA